jgi:very-short-patch-repair endonuclease
LGLSRRAIQHRIARGRLHQVMRGVYAVGRPELSRRGRWMAAVLSCGPSAVLSHASAAALWGIAAEAAGPIEISIRSTSSIRRPGVRIHRRPALRPGEIGRRHEIPVTTPVRTLVDLASRHGRAHLERAVNEADRLDLVDPDTLRASLDAFGGQPGVARLRGMLDRLTFRLTDSELEQRFLRLTAAAGLPLPQTGQWLNGFRVDFHWPELGLVVETDGLRYHRTPAQQGRDRLRDQANAAAGLTTIRFTHAQVRFEPARVTAVLSSVARRLRESGGD